MQPYVSRRERLIQTMQENGGGIAIFPTAKEAARNADVDHPYRHDSTFYYLSGFDEPEALIAILAVPGQPPQSILFCRPKNLEREIWDGYRHGPEAAQKTFGFDQAWPFDKLAEIMPDLIQKSSQLYYSMGRHAETDQLLTGWINQSRARARTGAKVPAAIQDVRIITDEMRLFKDEHEIAILRRAGKIAAQGHIRAMQTCRVGQREYDLDAELAYVFRKGGAQGVAYGSIVATGANACVLHYRAGDTEIRDGDLILIDAGCELDSYAADITRTFPANGTFSPAQKQLYELVLEAHRVAVAETRPGRPVGAAHDAVIRVLSQGMLDTGLLDKDKVGSLDDVIGNKHYTRFYMHGTGHFMGMDVHDVGNYVETGFVQTATDNGARSRLLQPGMVLTIEPGIYVRPSEDVPEAFWNIGIRVEDDALVTENGCELMTTDVPKSVSDIEALMRHS